MVSNDDPKKIILEPSVIHEELPTLEDKSKVSHEEDEEEMLPENPERNYHHGVNHIIQDYNEITSADDDVWNGEDA